MSGRFRARARLSRRPERAIPGAIERARLDNGLELVLIENRQAPIVSSALFYRVGTRDELAGQGGIAHFLEHLMFKGSPGYGPGEIDRLTQALGGTNNAFTSHDVTSYWFAFAAGIAPRAFAIEADRMRALTLDPGELDAERSVVIEEIAMYEDDPWDALELAVQRALYGGHPYGRSILGSAQSLAALGRDQLAAFHARHYRPDRALLVVAGALDSGVVERVREAFGEIAPSGVAREECPAPEPIAGARRVELDKGETPRLLLAIPVPPTDAPDHALLRLAATVLAEGRSSRLQRALVEEGQLCLGVSMTLSESPIASFAGIGTELLPGSELARVEATIATELARLRDEEISEPELERARHVFFADWTHSLERIHEQALAAGMASTLFDLGQPERLLEEVTRATPDALRDAARRWLDPARASVTGVARPEADAA